ncbi:MAG TPA: phosphatase PAP2 family protein [Micropepsaceae bacterium]
MRKCFFVPALLLLLGATPALSLSDTSYLAPGAFDSVHLLPPPPRATSPQQGQDIDGVLRAQQTASPERIKRAEEDAKVDIAQFAAVLGTKFSFTAVPGVAAFFRKVARDTREPVNMAKDCWERPRPFVADDRVHPPGAMREETANRPGATPANSAPHDRASPCLPVESPSPEFSYSYPSGHSTFGAMTAILLANMVPEKRNELFVRGWDYGQSRIIGGVHFPTDVESGRIEATAMVALMMQNTDFRTDFAAAKAELRKALGLSE